MTKLLLKTLLSCFGFIAIVGCSNEAPIPVAKEIDTSSVPANVWSNMYEVTSWSYESPQYYANLNVPVITSSAMQTLAVMVYFSKNGENIWTALPFTQYNTGTNYMMGFTMQTGQVQINWIYNSPLSKGKSPNEFYETSLQYKVVVLSHSARTNHPKIDLTNYEEVKNTFRLSE